MWITRRLSEHERQDTASAQDGTVTLEGAETAVFSSGEKRAVKTVGPEGFCWKPRKGSEVLVVRGGVFGEEVYAVGAIAQEEENDDLAPGEVRIRAAAEGSGEIVLRSSGKVEINGRLFVNGRPFGGLGD